MKYQDEKMDDFLVKLTKIVKQNEINQNYLLAKSVDC